MENLFKLGQDMPAEPAPQEDVVQPLPPASVGKLTTYVNHGRAGLYLAIGIDAQDAKTKQDIITKFTVGSDYREFRGKFTKLITKENFNQTKSELEKAAAAYNFELDTKGLDYAYGVLTGETTDTGEQIDVKSLVVSGDVDTTLANMQASLRDAIKQTPGDERTKMISGLIDKQLETLEKAVDDDTKWAFLNSFLALSQRLYRYSFGNQMLIWWQTGGGAVDVQAYKKWKELGRYVKKGAQGISIWVPIQIKAKDASGKVIIDPATKAPKKKTIFVIKPVFDIADTEKFEGKQLERWKKKHPDQEPYERPPRDVWMSKQNKDTSTTVTLRTALLKWIGKFSTDDTSPYAGRKIDINFHADTGTAGGWSAGGRIEIDKDAGGERQLSTLIHELAHELLHWQADGKKSNVKYTKQEVESDAEATAFIVMNGWGFKSIEYVGAYMKLLKIGSNVIKKRRGIVNKVSKDIIEGMWQEVQDMKNEGQNVEANWYRDIKVAKMFNSLLSPIRSVQSKVSRPKMIKTASVKEATTGSAGLPVKKNDKIFKNKSDALSPNQHGSYRTVFDIQRYVMDSYMSKVAISKTNNKITVSITVAHGFLGTITWDEYWYYDLNEIDKAHKTYKAINKILKDTMEKFVDEEIPTPMFWAFLRKETDKIDPEGRQRINIPVLNYSRRYSDLHNPDWRSNLYGTRYPDHQEESYRQYLNSHGPNS